MQGAIVTIPIHVPGTLAANLNIRYAAPFDLQLVQISACGGNANDGLLDLGTATDGSSILSAVAIGDSGVPALFGKEEFAGGEYPHFSKGSVVTISLDYDGALAVATADFSALLTFTEG